MCVIIVIMIKIEIFRKSFLFQHHVRFFLLNVVYASLLLAFHFMLFALRLIIIFIKLLILVAILRWTHSNTELFNFQNLSAIFWFLYLNLRIINFLIFCIEINILTFFIIFFLNQINISVIWIRKSIFWHWHLI